MIPEKFFADDFNILGIEVLKNKNESLIQGILTRQLKMEKVTVIQNSSDTK